MTARTALLRDLAAYGLNLCDSLGIEPTGLTVDSYHSVTINAWGVDPGQVHAALDGDGWPPFFLLGGNHAAREHSVVLGGERVKLRAVTDPIAGNFPHNNRQSW